MNFKDWMANAPDLEEMTAMRDEAAKKAAEANAWLQFFNMMLTMKRGLGGGISKVTPPGNADPAPQPVPPDLECFGVEKKWKPHTKKCMACPVLDKCAEVVAEAIARASDE